MSTDVIEVEVCDCDALKDGEMKEVDVGGTKVLLIKDNGAYYAIGSKCSHYGAPLVNGTYCQGQVRCPWHGACFDIHTGDIEDFPGVDGIPQFPVEIRRDGKVVVKAKSCALSKSKVIKPMAKACSGVQTVVLIIGGGPAATVCAQTLRQEGFQGKIIVTTKENHLPYDRPKLSKALNVTPDQIALRDAAFYTDNQIEFQFGKEATKVDCDCKKVTFKDCSELSYDTLVLATGTYARVLNTIPGYDLKNIVTLRSIDDAIFIGKEAENKEVVILGTSFIGVELAATLVGKAKSVTVVDLVEAPFQLALGKEVGGAVKKILDEKGVKFQFQTTAASFQGCDGKVSNVELKNGTTLCADLVVMGVGVLPVTDFLRSSGLNISDRGFVLVDKTMKTNKANVYAVGDITNFPLSMMNNDVVNVQHWQMAHQQGRIAALNIADKPTDIRSVPVFWTMLCGKSIRYTGYGVGYDDIVIHGSVDELKFVAFYLKCDRVIAVATLNYDPVMSQAAEMFYNGHSITRDQIRQDPLGWAAKLKPSTCTHF